MQRISLRTNRVVKTIRLGVTGSGPQGLAVSGSGVWVGSCSGGRLILINARKNRIVRRVRLPGFPCPEGVVATGPYRVDREQLRRLGEPLRHPAPPADRHSGDREPAARDCLGGGSVWVVNSGSSTVARLAAR